MIIATFASRVWQYNPNIFANLEGGGTGSHQRPITLYRTLPIPSTAKSQVSNSSASTGVRPQKTMLSAISGELRCKQDQFLPNPLYLFHTCYSPVHVSSLPGLPTPPTTEVQQNMNERQHFKLTSRYDHPKIRWFNGHFITARELSEVME
jgi:hypothetical protein